MLLSMLINTCVTLIFTVALSSLPGANAIQRLIIDVDAGLDDFQALVIILNAEHKDLVKIEAIVCTNGNARMSDVANNVLRLLETANRTDIPVYYGFNSSRPKPERTWYGTDGFADIEFKQPVSAKCSDKPGVAAMKDLIENNPNQISILALGPLTNIQKVLEENDQISSKIKEIYVMGGNYRGTLPEFNFKCDPEAASYVLTNAQCPITLLTWQSSGTGVSMDLKWRFSINLTNPIWSLNDRAERALYTTDFEKDPTIQYLSCDGVTALAMIEPAIIRKQSKHAVSVEIQDPTKLGLVVINDNNDANRTVQFVESVDSEMFKLRYVENFKDICVNYNCLDLF